jgi:hypothetical protein
MPDGADEATILDLMRELLELDVRITWRDTGLRLSDAADDPHADTDTIGPDAKLTPAIV